MSSAITPAGKEVGRGLFGTMLAVSLLVLLLNMMYIRELTRSPSDRFMGPATKTYPISGRVLRVLLIIELVLTAVGALAWVAMGSLGVSAVNNA